MEILPKPGEILLVTSTGKAKRLAKDEFPKQGRYGQGVSAWKLISGEKIAGLAVGKGAAQAVIHTKKLLPKPIRFDEVPLKKRAANGQTIYEIKPDNLVTRMTVPEGIGGTGPIQTGNKKEPPAQSRCCYPTNSLRRG